MRKNLWRLGVYIPILLLFLIGCDWFNKDSSTNSGSGTTTQQQQPPHGQVTYNLLEKSPFRGKQLDSSFWSNLEAYCKAGPTELIIADMLQIPSQMSRAGFVGRPNAQYYALSRTVGGAHWSPGDDTELQALKAAQNEIDAWWSRYIQEIVKIMEKAPQTTAIIITNDAIEYCGRSLGYGTYKMMSTVIGRVSMGNTVPD